MSEYSSVLLTVSEAFEMLVLTLYALTSVLVITLLLPYALCCVELDVSSHTGSWSSDLFVGMAGTFL